MLGLTQATGGLQRGDDGKVVRYLGVVEHALGGLDVAALERRGRVRCQMAHAAVSQHLEGALDHRHIVFGQVARIGTRVGQGLVALVQRLRNRQRGLGGEAELAVGLALQTGQVKQQRRGLAGGLAFFRHAGGLAAHGLGNLLRLQCAPDAVGLELYVVRVALPLRVEPLGGVGAGQGIEGGMHFPIVAADKFADLLFALHHHRQGGRLHPAHSGQEEAAIA